MYEKDVILSEAVALAPKDLLLTHLTLSLLPLITHFADSAEADNNAGLRPRNPPAGICAASGRE